MTAQRKTRPRGFADWNPRPDTLALVGQVQSVLDEYREHLDPRGWATRRMAEALGWYLARFHAAARKGRGQAPHDTRAGGWAVRPASGRDTRPRGGGLTDPVPAEIRAQGDGLLFLSPAMQAWAERQLAAFREREAQRAARRRVVCGAKTRKGTPCRNKSEPGRRRCKFHGGRSTGARTPEGIERIREAQRRRWASDKSASALTAGQGPDPAVTCEVVVAPDARPLS